MSNLKKVTKIAKKAYKKVPKKKLVNTAATYGFKQFIGGPYLDIITLFYKRTKKKALSYVGTYAYDSFLRSKFARDKLNTLPMSMVSLGVRSIANFLIFSRMITGIRLLDFIMSMIVTIIITLLSPFFYTSIKAHEYMFLLYTNIFVDRFMGPEGWEYVEEVKNRILLFTGLVLVFILQFVKIDSKYLQEIIVHALITGFISDKIQRWMDKIPKIQRLHYGMTNIEVEKYVLTPKNFIIPSYKRVKECHTDNRVIIGELNPQRAVIIPHDKLKEYVVVDMPDSKDDVSCVDIVEDYSSDRNNLETIEDLGLDFKTNIRKKLK